MSEPWKIKMGVSNTLIFWQLASWSNSLLSFISLSISLFLKRKWRSLIMKAFEWAENATKQQNDRALSMYLPGYHNMWFLVFSWPSTVSLRVKKWCNYNTWSVFHIRLGKHLYEVRCWATNINPLEKCVEICGWHPWGKMWWTDCKVVGFFFEEQ